MRHFFLPACICFVTLSGVAGADEIQSGSASATGIEDITAPAPVADAPVSESPDQVQSAFTLNGLALLLSIIPGAFHLGMGLLMFRYRITDRFYETMKREHALGTVTA